MAFPNPKKGFEDMGSAMHSMLTKAKDKYAKEIAEKEVEETTEKLSEQILLYTCEEISIKTQPMIDSIATSVIKDLREELKTNDFSTNFIETLQKKLKNEPDREGKMPFYDRLVTFFERIMEKSEEGFNKQNVSPNKSVGGENPAFQNDTRGSYDGTMPYDDNADKTNQVDNDNYNATAVTDTAVADTAVADTAVADTAVADTAVVDTAVVDTAVIDTADNNNNNNNNHQNSNLSNTHQNSNLSNTHQNSNLSNTHQNSNRRRRSSSSNDPAIMYDDLQQQGFTDKQAKEEMNKQGFATTEVNDRSQSKDGPLQKHAPPIEEKQDDEVKSLTKNLVDELEKKITTGVPGIIDHIKEIAVNRLDQKINSDDFSRDFVEILQTKLLDDTTQYEVLVDKFDALYNVIVTEGLRRFKEKNNEGSDQNASSLEIDKLKRENRTLQKKIDAYELQSELDTNESNGSEMEQTVDPNNTEGSNQIPDSGNIDGGGKKKKTKKTIRKRRKSRKKGKKTKRVRFL